MSTDEPAVGGGSNAAAADDEAETPLFMTRPPAAPNAALDALAAIIDEDEGGEQSAADESAAAPRRRKRGLGEVQVTLALTSCDDVGLFESRRRRQRERATCPQPPHHLPPHARARPPRMNTGIRRKTTRYGGSWRACSQCWSHLWTL